MNIQYFYKNKFTSQREECEFYGIKWHAIYPLKVFMKNCRCRIYNNIDFEV